MKNFFGTRTHSNSSCGLLISQPIASFARQPRQDNPRSAGSPDVSEPEMRRNWTTNRNLLQNLANRFRAKLIAVTFADKKDEMAARREVGPWGRHEKMFAANAAKPPSLHIIKIRSEKAATESLSWPGLKNQKSIKMTVNNRLNNRKEIDACFITAGDLDRKIRLKKKKKRLKC